MLHLGRRLPAAITCALCLLLPACGEPDPPAPEPPPLVEEPVVPEKPAEPAPPDVEALRAEVERLKTAAAKAFEDALKSSGYREFPHAVPEDVAFRDHAFIREVEAASRKRWFKPEEGPALESAFVAWQRTRMHRQRLIDDHRYRAAETMRANLALDTKFGRLHQLSHWAGPFLLVYGSRLPLAEHQLDADLEGVARRAELRELASRRKRAQFVLREKGLLYQQLHAEFVRRYGTVLGLKDLTAPWGGRPDMPTGVRSYADGVPLLVWIYADTDTYRWHHENVLHDWPLRMERGYFSQITGRIILAGPGIDLKRSQRLIDGQVSLGAFQLLFWCARQLNRWRMPKHGTDFFATGLASMLGSVRMDPSRKLAFVDVNASHLRDMHDCMKDMKERGAEYRLFPLARLTGFGSRGAIRLWGAEEWNFNPNLVAIMFRQQSWALLHFLTHFENGLYRKPLERFSDLYMHREAGGEQGNKAFMEAFRIRDPDDWARLDRQFKAYVEDHLMKLDVKPYEYEVPALTAWK